MDNLGIKFHLRSVGRTINVLELLMNHPGPVAVKAISEEMGMSLQNTYHHAWLLEESGLIIKVRGGYALGPRLIQLGAEAVRRKRERLNAGSRA